MRVFCFDPRLLAESTWKAVDNTRDADGLLPCAVCDIIERQHSVRSHSAMSQGGHLVKPSGSRQTWAIMYRDTEGKLRWEGKFRTKSNAQTRLSEVLNEIDKGTYSRPSSLSFEQFAKEWPPTPWQYGSRL